MTDLMQKSIRESISNVMNQIGGVDEGLASLFGSISEILLDEKRRREESERDGMRRNKHIVKGTLDGIGIRGAINTIPFGELGDCLEECVAIAFGKIKSKNGFIKIAKKVNDYWLNCGAVNSKTIFLTDSWDIVEFNSSFRESCNKYTSSKNRNNIKHTVAIILYGDYGFSLQYLR